MEKIILEELVKLNNCYGKLSEKIDNLDNKLDNKIQDLDNKLDNKIQELDNKLDSKIQDLDNKLDSKIQELDNKLDSKIQELDNKLDSKIQELDNKLVLTRNQILDQFGDTLEIIDAIILKSKDEIINKFEEKNKENEIRFSKIENDIIELKKYIV